MNGPSTNSLCSRALRVIIYGIIVRLLNQGAVRGGDKFYKILLPCGIAD